MEIMFNKIKNFKMRKVKYIYGALVLFLSLVTVQSAVAQNEARSSSPMSIELMKARSLWFNTGNSAGLLLDNAANFTTLDFKYQTTNGDFKLRQEGEKERTLGLSTEGGQMIGEGYGWGKFSYNNEVQRNTLFNTAMLNPRRGVPFYPVDANLSDWVKQDYFMTMKVASKPLWERYILGMEATYEAKTGAKQVDPRSEVFFYSINLKPSIVAVFGEHIVGLNFEYENMVQEGRRHTNSNSQVNQDVFVMKGLGNHYTAVIGGLQGLSAFQYTGNKVGAAIQYSYNICDYTILATGGYSYRVEDVIRDRTKPKKEGSVEEDEFSAGVVVVKNGDNLNRLEISYTSYNTNGIEYVQVLDNTYEVQKWVDLYSSIRSNYSQKDFLANYSFFRDAAVDYRWKAGAFVNYRFNQDFYYVPFSKMVIENLYLGVNGAYNIPLNAKGKFIAGADFIYKNNMDGAYKYGGAEPAAVVITDFMMPDFQFMKQDYIKVGGALSYFSTLGKENKFGFNLKLNVDYFKPSEGDDNRVLTSFGLGFTF